MTLLQDVELARIEALIKLVKPEIARAYHGRVVLVFDESQATLLVAYLEKLHGVQQS